MSEDHIASRNAGTTGAATPKSAAPDLAKLARVARSAMQGGWVEMHNTAGPMGVVSDDALHQPICWLHINVAEHENAAHISTFDPPTVLALIRRVRELEAALKPFAEASEHLHPATPDGGVTLDGIEVRHWRRAFAATAQAVKP